VARVLKLMFPVTLGLGLINFNAAIIAGIGARLVDKDIAPSAINAAFRLYMLPQGMFSFAVATVLFPALARLAARNELDGFRATVATGLRQIAFLLVPASVVCAVLATPITRLVYQRGEFTPDQTPVVAGALAAFSLGLAFNGAMLMLNRAFFSLQSNWLPTAVAGANLVFNTALALAFYRLGVWGLALSTSLSNIAGTAALLFLLRRRIGRVDFARTAVAVARIAVASIPLAIVSFGVWEVLDGELGRSFLGQLVSLAAALTAGAAAYLGACRILGVREIEAVLSLRERFRRT
jgi:putative peptidoglycan lipid II flippase